MINNIRGISDSYGKTAVMLLLATLMVLAGFGLLAPTDSNETEMAASGTLTRGTMGTMDPLGLPHYFGPYANYANSPMPKGAVTDITVDVSGSGYTSPVVVIDDVYGTGANATATATAVLGKITAITMTNVGDSYTAPIVTILDPTGAGAAATANMGGALTGGIRKFVDSLPGLNAGGANNLGNYIPIAIPDKVTYPGCDYYEIALVRYTQKLHTDLPPTLLMGYVQLETPANYALSKHIALKNPDGTNILTASGAQAIAAEKPYYLGPTIIASINVPTRVTFYNLLPTGAGGDLFLPVDSTVMGSGMGPLDDLMDPTMKENYTENRATLHLHGGNTPWISDGTPHQWTTPAGETTQYPDGVSVRYVPDMWFVSGVVVPNTVGQITPPVGGATNKPSNGALTFYYTNQQSARLMFYHDHAFGITRLNVYAGEAAAYLLTDPVEAQLIGSGILPNLGGVYTLGIPLVIQDKTFVDASTIAYQDPTWAWGSKPGVTGTPVTGDLWMPHVYMPNQNPGDPSGMNAYGRWHYGPWFWPPTDVMYGPVANPYYDPLNAPWEPLLNPGVPDVAMAMEAYMDTPTVNGAVYPYLDVEPQAYRFRVLNAANDRFFNLQLYVADPAVTTSDGRNNTEVKMVPAVSTPGYPEGWPTDGRVGGVPDPAMIGPSFIQIGTEGGFLPKPAVLPTVPVNWNLDPTNFDMGVVNQQTLLLGCAERADVVVDFSKYAGKTLILYNDAPAAFPALDARYDYYTGNGDHTSSGGTPNTQAGYGPNTRTVMQFRVANLTPAPTYDLAALEQAFASTPERKGVFESSQPTIIVPQAEYNSAYGKDFPADTFVRILDTSLTFKTVSGVTVSVPFDSKAIQDEQGEAFDTDYGRTSGLMGLQSTTLGLPNFMLYGFASPPVDLVSDCSMSPLTEPSPDDGTQIWKITHNGVDTHPIHVHLFNVQLINRVAWDNALRLPDANELGWKETVRVNPLQDTIVALRPVAPTLPFELTNSIRLIDPTMPAGDMLVAPPLGFLDPQAVTVSITNHEVNYGWEYVYHCHILGHEEMDMMHAMPFAVAPYAPTGIGATLVGTLVNLTWTDNSIGETEYIVQKAIGANPWVTLAVRPSPWGTTGPTKGNSMFYLDTIAVNGTSYYYRVLANNVLGDTAVYAGSLGFPTVEIDSKSDTVKVDTSGAGTISVITPPGPTAPPMTPYTTLYSKIASWTPPQTTPSFVPPTGGLSVTTPFRIDSNADFDAAHHVTAGSGTALDPWIIENLDINGEGSSNCIYIGNTTDHFILRNCYLHQASLGIFRLPYSPDSAVVLNNVINGQVSRNTLYSNSWAGVYVDHSGGLDISNNTAICSNHAIYLNSTKTSVVQNNTLTNNFAGIWLYRSNNNTLVHNTAHADYQGIVLAVSNDNRLINNSVSYNIDHGIRLFSASTRNAMTTNVAAYNGGYGFFLSGVGGNTIYGNSFKGNIHQAYDDSTNNWDNGYPAGGNYWSDYTGADAFWGPLQNNPGWDGIGDTPYTSATGQGISGGANKDGYPIMSARDYWPPAATVEKAVPYWLNTNPRTIGVTASDILNTVQDCTLRYRYSANNVTWGPWTVFQKRTAAPWQFAFTFPSGQGYYVFEANATDTVGNREVPTGVVEALCGHDTTLPTSSASSISPFGYVAPPATITAAASDPFSNLLSVSLYYTRSMDNLTWSAPVSYTLFGKLYNTPWSWTFTFPSGVGYYRFYTLAADKAGNTEAVPVTYDAIALYMGTLTLRIDNPTNGQYASGNLVFKVKTTDAVSLSNVYLNLRNLDTASMVFNVTMAYNMTSSYYEYSSVTSLFADGNYSASSWSMNVLGIWTGALSISFKIDNNAPALTVTSPTTGAYVSGSVTILASVSDKFLNNTQYMIDTGGWHDVGIVWYTLLVSDGPHTLTVRALDLSGKSTTVVVPVIVANTPPTCRIDNPNSGQYVYGTLVFKVSATNPVGISVVYLNLRNQDISSTVFNVTMAYNATSSYYEYTSATTILSDGNYSVASWSRDLAGKWAAATPVAFRIDNNAPALTVTSPTTGAYVSGSVGIMVTVSDIFLNNTRYQIDTGVWADIGIPWNTRLSADGSHIITVRAQDLSGKATSVMVPVIVDNNAPTCRIDAPTSGQFASGVLVFKVSANDAVGIGNTYLELRNLDTASIVFNITMAYNATSGYYEYTSMTTMLSDGNYSVASWSRDISGTWTAAVPVAFKIDNNAPNLLVTSPTSGAYVSGSLTIVTSVSDTFLNNTMYKIDAGIWIGISSPWNTLLQPDGGHVITVRALDLSGKSTAVVVPVTVDNNAPTCRIDNPVSGMFASGTLVLKVSSTDAVGIDRVYVHLWNLDVSNTVFNISMSYNATSGYYEYSTATGMVADGNYRASSWSRDLSGKWTTATPVAFKIDNNAPTLLVISPTTGAYVSGSVSIVASVSDTFLNTTMYKIDTGAWVDISIPWNTLLAPEGAHTIQVRALDLSGRSTNETVPVIVDNTAPTCRIDNPTSAQFVSGELVFKVSATDAVGIGNVYLRLLCLDTSSTTFNLSMTYNTLTGYYEYATATGLIADGNYSAASWSRDLSGKWTAAVPVAFKIDNNAPNLLVISPVSGAYVSGLVSILTSVSDVFLNNTQYKADVGAWVNISTPWNTSLMPDGNHTLTVRALDLSGKSTVIVIPVIVDNNAPTCRIDEPVNGQFISGVLVFKVSAADTVGIGSVYLNLRNLDLSNTVFNITMAYDTPTGYYDYSLSTGMLADGNYSVASWSRDLSAKITAAPTVAFEIDNNAPTLLVISPVSGDYVSGSVPIVTSVSDIFLKSTQYNIDAGPWVNVSVPWNTRLVSEGAHSITVRALDLSGQSTTRNVPVIVDNFAPTCRMDAPTEAQFVSGDLLFKVSATDAVGIKNVYLNLRNLDMSSTVFNITMTYDATSGYYELMSVTDLISDGNYRASSWSQDLSGKWTAAVPVVFRIDNNAPSLEVTDPVPGAYVSGSVTITAAVSDTFLDSTQYNVDGGAWVAIATPWNTLLVSEGAHTLTLRASDLSGKSTTSVIPVVVDNNAPTCRIDNPADADFISGDLLFKVSATDAVGIESVFLNLRNTDSSSTVFNITMTYDAASGYYEHDVATGLVADGNYRVSAWSKDLSGRLTSAVPVGFKIDNNAPALTLASPAPGAYVSGNVTILATVADTFLDSTRYNVDGGAWVAIATPWNTLLASEGAHIITVRALDMSGKGTAATVSVIVDNIAPTCRIDAPAGAQFLSAGLVFKVSAADAVGIAGVYLEMLSLDASSTAFNVSMTYNLASGYYEYSYATTMIADGNYRVSAWSKDFSSRWTTAAPVSFKIDNNAPTLIVASPAADAYVSGSVTILATVADTFLDKTQYSVDGGAWIAIATPWNTLLVPGGAHTLSVRASDLSGKSTAQTIPVVVDNTIPTITLVSPIITDKLNGNVTVKVYIEQGQGLKSARGGLAGKEAEMPKGFDGLYTVEIDTKALGISDGNLAMTFYSENLVGKTASLALEFKVDNKAPTMTVVSGTSGNLLITASFAPGDTVTGAYVRVDGGNWLEMSKVDDQTYTYRWPTKESNNGRHSIEVKATDEAGNEARQTSTITVNNKKSYSYLWLPILLIILIALLVAVLLFLFFRRRQTPTEDAGPKPSANNGKNGKNGGKRNNGSKTTNGGKKNGASTRHPNGRSAAKSPDHGSNEKKGDTPSPDEDTA